MTIRQRKPIKRVNAARKRREFARAYHSKARVAWVKSLPCIARNVDDERSSDFECAGPMCNAHTSGDNGASYKSSARFVVPACQRHHDEMHEGVDDFCVKYNVALDACAEDTHARWLSHCGGAA